jgi:hypothetical protein
MPTSPVELHAQVQALTAQVEELTQRLDQRTATQDLAPADGQGPKLLFGNLEAWVHGLFLPMFSWRVDGQRWFWCPRWWWHAEAIWRLELLWRSWEAARLQPLGMSVWSLEVDRHVRELLGDEGTFRQCRGTDGDRPARHVDLEPATAEPAPASWWD